MRLERCEAEAPTQSQNDCRPGVTPDRVRLPPEVKYSCHHCGVCCSLFPKISVDRSWRETLRQYSIDSFAHAKGCVASLEEALVPDPEDDSSLVLRRRQDGACVFLTEDRMCELHVVAGGEAKPQVCRDFPYIFRASPGGVFVGLSFACPSVRNNLGESLAGREAALAEHARRAKVVDGVTDRLRFDGSYELDWESYELLEHSLDAVVARNDGDLLHRLTACHVLLGMFRLWLDSRVGRESDLLTRRCVPSREVEEFFLANEARDFAEPLRIARRPRGQRSVRRGLVGLVTACAAAMWRTGHPSGAAFGLIRNYLSGLFGLGRMAVPPLPAEISPRLIDAQSGALGNEFAEDLLTRYVRMALFRKDLAVAVGGVQRGWDQVLMQVGLVRIYAQAVAWCQRRSVPCDEDWSLALQYVETYYGHHSRLFEVLESVPRLAMIFDSLMGRKNYPDVILGRMQH